jgi:hypothetical protein
MKVKHQDQVELPLPQPALKKARTRDDIAGHQGCKDAQNALPSPPDNTLAQSVQAQPKENKQQPE